MAGTDSEGIGDIHTYLEHFSPKEVGSVVISKTEVLDPPHGMSLGSADASGSGQYFVDQATGQYYFQSSDGEPFTVVEDELLPRGAASPSPPTTTIAGLGPNQVVLNTGDDQYQTVTIVPNDSSSGEVSYVLIVQQNEDKKIIPDQQAEVYEFEGEESDLEEDLDMDNKGKVLKNLPRKHSLMNQAHMCNYCNYTSPKRYLLSRHMKSHSEERPHKCSVCERGFKTLASLQNHVNTHTGTKPHRCKFCHAHFTTSGELVRHVRYRHTHEKPHKCPDCDYESVELSKLKRHMRCHSGERPYQCPNCTYASPDTFKLKRHLRIHTGEKPYECDICHAKFTQSNSLKAHKTIHTDPGDKPQYQCELCPTTCGRKTDLRLHVQKLHTSEKPMNCKLCDKSFPDRYTLKMHKKSHEGEKCYRCELCPYSSISQRHLESHMLIHTDQKPYRCDQCDQSFRQKQLLKRHQNLYHNPAYVPPSPKEKTHECVECNRNFRHKGNLMRHLALHDPDSSVQEKAMALKYGRQKKIQIIDGHQVEVLTGEGSDEDGEDSIGVEGQDGEYYVVLEVTQLGEGGDSQQVVHIANSQQISLVPKTEQIIGLPAILEDDNLEDSILSQAATEEDIKLKKQQERASCFGFDDEEEED